MTDTEKDPELNVWVDDHWEKDDTIKMSDEKIMELFIKDGKIYGKTERIST